MEAAETPSSIGRFQIVAPLGRGGMGVVYRAHDVDLERDVAIKLLNQDAVGRSASLLKEARAAARVRHPAICTVFEVGEHEGVPYLVMELLDGDSLERQLASGPMDAARACDVLIQALGGLDALHRAGLVHLDLKPANIFVTPYGVKVLDFGLTRAARIDPQTTQTQSGALIGTPAYMAPEQIRGDPVDSRADIFAAGAVLFELVTGRRPFRGETFVDLLQAVLTEHPPAISGSAMLTAIDRVVQRAMAKQPPHRFDSASAMASDLRLVAALAHHPAPVMLTRVTRVAFLPFRSLRVDPEIAFLELGLADALGASLASHDNIVIRSALTLPPSLASSADLRSVGADLDADLLITGTLLRSGNRVRVTAQAVDVGTGHATWGRQMDGSLDDIFDLQDRLAAAVVSALPAVGEHRAGDADIPRSQVAYTLFLQANQLARSPQTWTAAMALFRESTLADDRFAPAWAGLGRLERVLGKYQVDGVNVADGYAKAERALERALSLNPDLPQAHFYYAQLEADSGRTEDALRRLLRRVRARRTDADIYAGLVQICRYCDLFDASLAAHGSARALDPGIRTSVALTRFAMLDFAEALKIAVAENTDDLRMAALDALGRRAEALELARLPPPRISQSDNWVSMRRAMRAYLEGDVATAITQLGLSAGIPADATVLPPSPDGEDLLWTASFYTKLGRYDLGLSGVRAAVDQGYFAVSHLATDPALAPLRSSLEFVAALDVARTRRAKAARIFVEEQGPLFLGVEAPRFDSPH